MKSHQLRMSALAVAISMALTSSPALAQQIQNSSTQQVSLSSQNLDQALIQWANTYNTQLVVDQSIVKGLQAPTVSGKYTARQALNLLLAGSGLQVLESNGNYVVTKPALSSNPNNAPKLSSVVVSASGFEQDLAQAPASISVISREELQTKQFRDLAEALKDVEGIDVRGSTGKTGGLNISIRGLPSDYTLVLIDGRRQNTAGDVTPNGFGDALTSLIPPLSAIERIEVIRGPMSTLYGSDALGGVINIITRKVGKTWGGSVQLETGIPENSDEGGTQKQSFYVSGPLVENTVGLAIRGSLFRRDESTLEPSTPGGTISRRGPSPVETRQHNLGFRLTATPNISNDLWLDFESYRTTYDNDECQLGTRDFLNCNTGAPSNTASGYADSLSFNRQQFVLGHTTRMQFGTLESSLTRSITETEGRTIPSSARPAGDASIGTARRLETTNTILDTKLVTPIGDQHVVTTGAQYWDAELEDGLVPNPYTQTTWALFAEDEWRLRDDLALTLGLRQDQHDAFGGNLSPRAYLVWNTSDAWTLKGGISRGFRAPRLNQLADGISGISGQGTVISIGNPALKPEISTNTEFGALYDNQAGFTVSSTLFYNRIKDIISGDGGDCTSTAIPTCSFNPTATYPVNRDRADTYGLELATRIPIAEQWSANLNYTFTETELVEDGQNVGELSDTAKHIANAALRWDASDKWNWSLRGEYRGDSRRFDGDPAALTGNSLNEFRALGDLKGYTIFSLTGQYKVSNNVTLNGTLFNLLDKDFREFTPYSDINGNTVFGSPYFRSAQSTKGTLPGGRTLWLSANVTF